MTALVMLWATGPAHAAGNYTLKRGETLSQVAVRVRVSVADLARVNGIADVHRVRAGTRLVIPAPAAVPSKPRWPERLRQEPARLALMVHFDAAARDFRVPADLLKALTWLESGWQNHKVSRTKAMGIGQLMPDTVAFVNGVLLKAKLDPGKPVDNIRMSARFLAYLLAQSKSDVPTAVAAYYQGLASVRRDGPGPGTKRYVADVLALRARF